jgi:hypothetical protein
LTLVNSIFAISPSVSVTCVRAASKAARMPAVMLAVKSSLGLRASPFSQA